jgi:hypothetical protein
VLIRVHTGFDDEVVPSVESVSSTDVGLVYGLAGCRTETLETDTA